jgi:hypothetical protein
MSTVNEANERVMSSGSDLGSWLRMLYSPSEHVNYKYLLYFYIFCAYLCVVLNIAENGYDVEWVAGYWMLFLPAVPFGIWAGIMLFFQYLKEYNELDTSKPKSMSNKKKD